MKNLLLILLLFTSLSVVSQTRNRQSMRERIKAEKIAFITDKLQLTETEAKSFWPIYNKFETTTHGYKRNKLHSIKQKLRDNPKITEKEADELLSQLITIEGKMHKSRLRLVNDLKNVISSKKILKLKYVEEEFNRTIFKRLREFRAKRNRN